MNPSWPKAVLLVHLLLLAAICRAQPAHVLKDFPELGAWTSKAPGMDLRLSRVDTPHGPALSFDYDYRDAGNFALVHQECDVPMDGNLELSFWVKADTPDNNLELKLEDFSGNTYWYRRDSYRWPREWTQIVLRKRLIAFAWGPKSSLELSRLKSVEFVVSSSGAGRKGVILLTGLRITPLGEYGRFSDPVLAVAGSAPLKGPEGWHTTQPVSSLDLLLTLPKPTEFGGLELEWEPSQAPNSYELLASVDGTTWRQVQAVEKPNRSIDIVRTPDAEGRRIRIHAKANNAIIGLRRVKLLPPEMGTGGAELLKALARSSPRGLYHRHLLRQQAYWTLVGYSGGKEKALLCEDGQIELAKGRPSIDPFVQVDGKLYHWANTEESQGLLDGYLPLPWVERSGPVSLRVSSYAVKDQGGALYACYTLTNREALAKQARLILALRPIQVNPEWQHSGVMSAISDLHITPTSLSFGEGRSITLLTPAEHYGATPFSEGEMGRRLEHADLPTAASVSDPTGLASGYVAYTVNLKPGESRSFWWRYSLAGDPEGGAATEAEALALQSRVADEWRRILAPVRIQLPESEQRLVDLIRSNLAYIMINRDGVRLQPGSRNYNRSWIRDGSLMSAAMLHFGITQPAREYIEWYTGFVEPGGYVPAIIEDDKPLPTLECDAFGEYIYLVTEYWKFTHDDTFARRYYPVVRRVAEHIARLHREGQAKYRGATGVEALFYGLLPPSISHEGYGSPVHSNWDNYFGILGLKDAAVLARVAGEAADADRFLAEAVDLRRDVVGSLEATARHYGMHEIASCADYGESDPSGVSILANPCDEMSYMPADLFRKTFDDYYEICMERADGRRKWSGYTPYEFRNIGIFARFGDKDRALWLMRWFAKDTRPKGWNQWAEVVFQDERAPVYIGDMPHTWCAAEFVREIRDYFTYEEDLDKSLVFCSGVPAEWLQGRGIQVWDLPTAYGSISLKAATSGSADLYEVSGEVKAPGGVWLVAARGGEPQSVLVNGVSIEPAKRIKLPSLPAKVEFRY